MALEAPLDSLIDYKPAICSIKHAEDSLKSGQPPPRFCSGAPRPSDDQSRAVVISLYFSVITPPWGLPLSFWGCHLQCDNSPTVHPSPFAQTSRGLAIKGIAAMTSSCHARKASFSVSDGEPRLPVIRENLGGEGRRGGCGWGTHCLRILGREAWTGRLPGWTGNLFTF